MAAARSAEAAAQGATDEEVARWPTSLPVEEQNELLASALETGGGHLRAELLQRFRRATAASAAAVPAGPTVAELRAAAAQRHAARERREAAAEARERARQERKEAAARERTLSALAAREDDAWGEVATRIGSRKPADYDEAVRLLQDLREVCARGGRSDLFGQRLRQLRKAHATKRALMQRLCGAGL